MELAIVVAIDQNSAIGGNNQLLWHLPNDLKNFKKITLGHPVIMGRKTFDSILDMTGKVLPNRHNIVISRDKNFKAKYQEHEFSLFDSIDKVIDYLKNNNTHKAFIIGGAEIYKLSMPYVNKLYITLVKAKFENADVFFDFNLDKVNSKYKLISKQEHHKDARHLYDYDFLVYE
tara:strand:- start:174 stop:695 length:522 start_codon:yes stop_codon:yes gene_type:complete